MRRRTKRNLIFVGSLAALTSVFVPMGMEVFKNEGTIVSNFEDLLDYKGVPIGTLGARPLDVTPFSDMGAWHAYSLPTYEDTDVWGGFSGPLYVDKISGRYLSRSFNVIKITNSKNGKVYNLSKTSKQNVKFKSYPGGLWQEFKLDDFTLQLDLKFVTDKTSMITTNIINKTNGNLELEIGWTGSMFEDAKRIVVKDESKGYQAFDKSDYLPEFYNGVSVDFGAPTTPYEIGKWKEGKGQDDPTKFAVEDWKYQIQLDKKTPVETRISEDGLTYQMKSKNKLTIGKNKTHNIYQTNSFTFTKNERGIYESEDKLGKPYEYNPNDRRKLSDYKQDGEYIKVNEMLSSDKAARAILKTSVERWDKYIEYVIGKDNWINEPYQRGAIKAMETLITNWRGHAGFLAHQGITPSLSMDYFNGFWSWDSWKQAVAVSTFNGELAKDNIRTLFDFQARNNSLFTDYYGNKLIAARDMGMIPDYIAFRKSETNWRDTKPPLSGWSVWTVYQNTKDINFLKEMYKKVLAYHNWWYKNRDNDRNGILEYGGTVNNDNNSVSSILEAAAWESGLDNAPRFDINGYGPNDKGIKVLENINENNGLLVGYSINQESVCLNSYAYADKTYLILMARELEKNGIDYNEIVKSNDDGLVVDDMNMYKYQNNINIGYGLGNSFKDDIAKLTKDANYVKNYINTRMYDDSTKFFYDKEIDITANNNFGKTLSNRGKGSEGWTPLFTQASSHNNANGVYKTMMSKYTFNGKLPFQTASYDNPKFAPDQYWRGPVWLDQAYFGVEGLKNYGHYSVAQHQAVKIMDNADGFKNKGVPIRETYNPLTGGGQDSKNFSWSAGMLMLLYQEWIRG